MDFFTHVTAMAALAVVALQQILKLNAIPLAIANKYPVPTLIILSIIAAVVTTVTTTVHPAVWTDWILYVATIAVIAAVVYNSTLRNWSQLRSMEGDGK